MALIKCPECGNQVSNTANACPKCGAPIAGASDVKATGDQLKTVQLTSKKLKKDLLINGLAFWIGVIWLVVAAVSKSQGHEVPTWSFVISGTLTLLGATFSLVTRFRIWWHHK